MSDYRIGERKGKNVRDYIFGINCSRYHQLSKEDTY